MDDIDQLSQNLDHDITRVKNINELENIQIKYLGRNGLINNLLKKIKEISPEEKKEFGRRINLLKVEVEKQIANKRKELVLSSEKEKYIDVTLPGKNYPHGSLHPMTLAIEEISHIFEKIGFDRLSYPEVEWEYFSFEALNMPKGHPARDEFETFFMAAPENPKLGKLLLTPHTSSGQIREMMRVKKPPIRMINIAKCYRPNWDVSHNPMFYQFEGLCIDKDINITHLKGTIDYFVKEFFGPDRQIRLRPFHFQFTEPSFEIDISCGVCGGCGEIDGVICRLCKSGWLELGGSGMVHPNVLKAGNIDHHLYSGWAFGIGVERCLMMKEDLNLPDIRILYNGDIRFLEQF